MIFVSGVHRGIIQALQHARVISDDIRAAYVDCEGPDRAKEIQQQWSVYVPYIPLIVLPSPYREAIEPVQEYLKEIRKNSNLITVVIPELAAGKWWTYVLHRRMATKLKNIILK